MKLFDAHMHIIDPSFPLVENNGYLPDAFTVDDYLARISVLGITSGAVVSGSFQAFDQSYLIDALTRLGKEYVGVTQVPYDISDEELAKLDLAGVRAVRFNLFRGGSEDVSRLQYMAERVHRLFGWHVELYANSAELDSLADLIVSLPKVSLDHLGMRESGLSLLKRLVEKGVKVKATGFGRVDFKVGPVIKQLYHINPTALMFGTDLPCTRAPSPFCDSHVDLVKDVLGEMAFEDVCWNNARRFYGFV